MAEILGTMEMTAETIQLIKDCTMEVYNFHKANATDANKAKAKELNDRFQTDPSYGASEMEVVNKIWTESDLNQDGRLDLEEFRAFMATTNARSAELGLFVSSWEGQVDKSYASMNGISAEEGLTMQEWLASCGIVMKLWLETDAAAAAAQ